MIIQARSGSKTTNTMWIQYTNGGTQAALNLDKVTAIRYNEGGTAIEFLGDTILQEVTEERQIYGQCVLEVLQFETADEAAFAYAHITRSISAITPRTHIPPRPPQRPPSKPDY